MAAVRIGVWFPPRISLDSGNDTVELYIAAAAPIPFIAQSEHVNRLGATFAARRRAFLALPQSLATNPKPASQSGYRPRWAPQLRRGRLFAPVPAIPTVAPGIVDVAGSRPRFTARPRRGQFLGFVPRQIGPGEGPLAPAVCRQARRFGLLPRRGAFSAPPAVAPAVPSALSDPAGSRPRWAALPRRGRFTAPVPPQVGPGEGPVVLGVRRPARRFGFLARRGQFLAPPLLAPVVASIVGTQAGPRPRFAARARRGQLYAFTPPQVGPGEGSLAPAVRRQARRFGFLSRRGTFSVPAAAVPVVAPSGATPAGFRPRWAALPRRGQLFIPVPAQTGPGEGPLVVGVRRPARRFGFVARRGAFLPWSPSAPVVAPTVTDQAGPRPRYAALPRRGQFFIPVRLQVGPGEGQLVGAIGSPALRRAFLARRGQFLLLPTPVPAVALTITRQAGASPRFAALPRRSHFFVPVPAQVGPGEARPPTPTYSQPGYRPRWAPDIRRGQFFYFPLPQVGPGEAVLVGAVPRLALRRGFLPRRGTFAPLSITSPLVPPATARELGARPRFAALPRRGHLFAPVPPQAGPGEGPLVPTVRRAAQRSSVPVRRGSFSTPQVGGAPLPLATIRAARRLQGTARRGFFLPLAPIGVPAALAGIIGARPRRVPISRRGQFWAFAPGQVGPGEAELTPCVTRQAGYLPKWTPAISRGQLFVAVPMQAGPGEGPLVPSVSRSGRRPAFALRRGAFLLLPTLPPSIARSQRARIRLAPNRRGSFQALPQLVSVAPGQQRAVTRAFTVRRGQFFVVTPAQVGPGEASLAPIVIHTPGWRPRWTPEIRRGQFQVIAPPQQGAGLGPLTGNVTRQPGYRPRWAPAIRRGSVLVVPPPQAGPGEAPAVPSFTRATLQRWRLARRGTFQAPTPLALVAIPVPRARPRLLPMVRRGQFTATPLAAPVPFPTINTRSAQALALRRGQFIAAPLAVAKPGPVAGGSSIGPHVRPRLNQTRRGQFYALPAAAAPTGAITHRLRLGGIQLARSCFYRVPTTSGIPRAVIRGRSAPWPTGRRGSFYEPPSPIGSPVPPWRRSIRSASWLVRRGRVFSATPTVKLAGPGPLCPAVHRAIRRHAGLSVRRGRWIQGVTPPQVFFAEPVAHNPTSVALTIATSAITVMSVVAEDAESTVFAVAISASTTVDAIATAGVTAPLAVAN